MIVVMAADLDEMEMAGCNNQTLDVDDTSFKEDEMQKGARSCATQTVRM